MTGATTTGGSEPPVLLLAFGSGLSAPALTPGPTIQPLPHLQVTLLRFGNGPYSNPAFPFCVSNQLLHLSLCGHERGASDIQFLQGLGFPNLEFGQVHAR